MTQFRSNFDGTHPVSDTCAQFSLSQNVQQSYTVPGENNTTYRVKATFASNSNVFVGLNVTATSPGSGTNTTTNYLMFKPDEPFYARGGDTINLITPDSAGSYAGLSLLVAVVNVG